MGERFVHVFEGATLETLLDHLDTAPDLIAYLTSRADVLSQRPEVEFRELDLLAVATENWMEGRGFTITLDANERRRLSSSPWTDYLSSKRARRTKLDAERSRIVDRLVDAFHLEHVTRRGQGHEASDPNRHEEAMRLLAAESRFARRIITASLFSILDEPVQGTFWASTVPSPTTPGLRYVWLTYPRPPSDWPEGRVDQIVHDHLSQHVLVAADTYVDASLIVGIALPNRSAGDTLLVMRVFDAADLDEETRRQAAHWRGQGVFRDLEPEHRIHFP